MKVRDNLDHPAKRINIPKQQITQMHRNKSIFKLHRVYKDIK